MIIQIIKRVTSLPLSEKQGPDMEIVYMQGYSLEQVAKIL